MPEDGNYKSLLPERTTKTFNLNGRLLQKEKKMGGGGKIGDSFWPYVYMCTG